ncbi:MAG: MGMT family protein [Clostridia bacterium]|nr:MGMT family protein [Clostridia bacterium]
MKDFTQQVLDILLMIPKGKVVTYGQIAVALGNIRYSRAVGYALHRNPDGEKYPCYKVVNRDGGLAPAFVFGGIDEQAHRLEAEGIEVVDGKVDLAKYQFRNLVF